jgi:hypothetical protein
LPGRKFLTAPYSEICQDQLRLSAFWPLSLATLVPIDILCSSSEVFGSFMLRKIWQGSSGQAPQSLSPFLFTAQSYMGHTFEGIISFAQKVDPFTAWQPVQLLLKYSQSLQINPQLLKIIFTHNYDYQSIIALLLFMFTLPPLPLIMLFTTLSLFPLSQKMILWCILSSRCKGTSIALSATAGAS